jgi:D-tyrosyl-tRNA(Tyr) deacylase
MKGLIQRVSEASVVVDGQTIGAIQRGILLLLGVERDDSEADALKLCQKVTSYRIFPDEQGRMNRSLKDVAGGLLIVPQFTLAADTGSGTRPGFSSAAAPDQANHIFETFAGDSRRMLGEQLVSVGRFGADMKVSLVNDGPVTFMLQTGRQNG